MFPDHPIFVHSLTYVPEYGTTIFLWACAIPIILLCFPYDTFKAWRKEDEQFEIPLVGPWADYLPRVILNAAYATSATKLLQRGYEKVEIISH